ncbi:FhlA [Desulforapulum autotrophicum HRM2]|uniref:FhlA n=1 Tax=Desulforapulum autotrophicum (strain ATCC 43914 / DSM 3382 / VKM B-1955 / HRM2) TaxID=177437 RepID=C0QE85_DESAH|nr:sigma 54-interacting transcriptional regulator [Desulforapulum autotrophicum]ACN13202.1 FhlA [Desulforapulum autotrophicum HRM2]
MNPPISTLTCEKTMDIVLTAIRELIEYELAVVLSCEGRSRLRVLKAAGPAATKILEGYTFSLEDRKDIAAIVQEGKPYLFDEAEPHVDTYAGVVDFPADHSCMVTPLYLDDTLQGVLTLDHHSCNRFTPQNVRLVGTLSKLISLAIAQSNDKEALEKEHLAILQERNFLLERNAGALSELIGNSVSWNRVKDAAAMVAASQTPVLIQGETGTGKEVVARAVHRLSDRKGGPFIPVNCSAISAGVAESELFGHEKGGFTGAVSSRKGRFELADGGTLFLDEIGDLPLEIQPKLLRALQEKKLERIGGESTISVDVRIIAASHVDLYTAVRENRFREDLYYRLNVFPIRLPPLRERGSDILILAEYFTGQIRARAGHKDLALAPESVDILLQADWPGNVRQLQNTLERAAILSRGGVIRAEHIVADETPEDSFCLPGADLDATALLRFDVMVKAYLQKVLTRTGGKVYGKGGAAEILDLKPTTLHSKLKKYGIR